LASSGLSADDGVSFPHEQEYVVLARVLIALAGADPVSPLLQDALRLLDRLLADAEAKTRVRSALEILVVRARAFAVQADWVSALTSLKQALVRAEPEGYVRLFLDEGTAMVALLRDAHAHGVTPAYVTTLLAACGEHIGAVPAPRPVGLLEPLTVRESDVLRLLVAGLSNAAIARELVVTIGTVKSHVNHIYGKLGVTSRTQAIARTHALHIGKPERPSHTNLRFLASFATSSTRQHRVGAPTPENQPADPTFDRGRPTWLRRILGAVLNRPALATERREQCPGMRFASKASSTRRGQSGSRGSPSPTTPRIARCCKLSRSIRQRCTECLSASAIWAWSCSQ
jgi:DNA-binding CsgD family transcriptional regulator